MWLDDLNAYLRSLTPKAEPSSFPEEEYERVPLPDNPTREDCGAGYGGSVEYNNGPSSAYFANLRIASYDSSGILWVEKNSEVVASLETSKGPIVSEYNPETSVPYALTVRATIDAKEINNNWVGYYISTGNAVLIDIARAIRLGRYQQFCFTSVRRSAKFLVTKDPNVVYNYCKPGGGFAVLGIYWPLYQAAQQRATGTYAGFGAFTIPPLPNVPALPVPKLPAWFGTVPMPKIMQPWVAMVIPGYTSPTQQEVNTAKSKITTGSSARDTGIGVAVIATLAIGAIALLVWRVKG
jgi:hypothetical protein